VDKQVARYASKGPDETVQRFAAEQRRPSHEVASDTIFSILQKAPADIPLRREKKGFDMTKVQLDGGTAKW
jgi:hypothetical protein